MRSSRLLPSLLASLTSLSLAAACGGPPASEPVAGARPAAGGIEALARDLRQGLQAAGLQRVAVVELFSSHGRPLGQFGADKLTLALQGLGGLELIERSAIASVLDEQALGQSGVLGDSAVEAGKLVGAQALVAGNITVLADHIDVTARALDAATGRVVIAAETRLPKEVCAGAYDPNVAPVAAAPLTLSTIFLGEHRQGASWSEVVVRDGTALRSGDGLKLVLETNRDAYVYALILDSQGKGSVIFPKEQIHLSNRIRGGHQAEIPPAGQWFFLDENPGTERLYVLASLAPMPQIQTLVERLEAMGVTGGPRPAAPAAGGVPAADAPADATVAAFVGSAAPAGPEGVIRRGLGGVRPGNTQRVQLSDGAMVEQAVDMISGAGAVVRAVSFQHEAGEGG